MTQSANQRQRVLITGGSGFLGRHALPWLLAGFDEVHATCHATIPSETESAVNWHPVDLLDAASREHLMAEVRPTHLLHLAWCTGHGRFWSDLANTRWLDASVALARTFAEQGGRRIVTAGTCAEYDATVGYCRELQTECTPVSLYGICKHAMQIAIASMEGLSAAHSRIFYLFGPHEDERRLVPSVIRSLHRGEPVNCTHGNQVRDFLYVKDAAAAHVRLLRSDVRGPVNVASGEPITIRQLVSTVAEKMGQPDAIRFGAIPQRAGEPHRLTARTTRLQNEVGFRPQYSLDLAMEETISAHTQTPRRHSEQACHPPTGPACPLCNGTHTVRFLRRADAPVHQNLIHRTRDAARSATRGLLEMHVCHDCKFVFNAAFDPALLSYGEQYDNTQTCSPAFNDYVNELVRHLLDDRGIRGKTIVEVGCGKGGFLRRLVEDPTTGNRGFGFDPTYLGPTEDLQGRLQFIRQFYDASAAHVACEAVVCRHVIEHVPTPGMLISAIRNALSASAAETLVFFETPCVRWIVNHGVVWDFFYEHCSLFTAESLRYAFELQGFAASEVRHIFGGQYLWLEAVPGTGRHAVSSAIPTDDSLAQQAVAYGRREARQVAGWQERMTAFARQGGVALWGAGAKGATFANLIDPEGTLIDCTVDLNPAKQGAFLPGTGTPIVAPAALAERRVSTIAVLNPNYLHEIRQQVEQLGVAARVVDLSHESDNQGENRSLKAA